LEEKVGEKLFLQTHTDLVQNLSSPTHSIESNGIDAVVVQRLGGEARIREEGGIKKRFLEDKPPSDLLPPPFILGISYPLTRLFRFPSSVSHLSFSHVKTTGKIMHLEVE